MKKILVAAGAALIVLAGCSNDPAAPVPAPTVTVTAAPETNDGTGVYAILEQVWNELSPSDQATTCEGYRNFPEVMWSSFNEGMGSSAGAITREQFDVFFSSKCL
jgi:hypothetical protein